MGSRVASRPCDPTHELSASLRHRPLPRRSAALGWARRRQTGSGASPSQMTGQDWSGRFRQRSDSAGPAHVHACHSLVLADPRRPPGRRASGRRCRWTSCSRSRANSNVQDRLVQRFPTHRPACSTRRSPADLRLNCLTATTSRCGASCSSARRSRTDVLDGRRRSRCQRLGDIDDVLDARPAAAHGACAPSGARRDSTRLPRSLLGMTPDELCGIYRTTFGVLRKYEHFMRHDQNGREVPKDDLDRATRRIPRGHRSRRVTSRRSPSPTARPRCVRPTRCSRDRYGGGVE